MARIRRLLIEVPGGAVHPTKVDCRVREVVGPRGVAFLELSTFGSDHRVSPPKVSQTIQLGREEALELSRFINEVFRGSDGTARPATADK